MSWPDAMPLAVVEWTDIQSHNGWTQESELKARFEENVGMNCRSAGFLYRDDETRVALLQNTADNGMVADILEIPRAMIKSVQIIAEPKRPEGDE